MIEALAAAIFASADACCASMRDVAKSIWAGLVHVYLFFFVTSMKTHQIYFGKINQKNFHACVVTSTAGPTSIQEQTELEELVAYNWHSSILF